jgi:hypothetical protein
MAVSDGVDGYLARTRKQITRLGSFLDPLADKLLITCACLLLASARAHVKEFMLPTTVVVFILGKDLLILTGFYVYCLHRNLCRSRFRGKLADSSAYHGRGDTYCPGLAVFPDGYGSFGCCGPPRTAISTIVYILGGKSLLNSMNEFGSWLN